MYAATLKDPGNMKYENYETVFGGHFFPWLVLQDLGDA